MATVETTAKNRYINTDLYPAMRNKDALPLPSHKDLSQLSPEMQRIITINDEMMADLEKHPELRDTSNEPVKKQSHWKRNLGIAGAAVVGIAGGAWLITELVNNPTPNQEPKPVTPLPTPVADTPTPPPVTTPSETPTPFPTLTATPEETVIIPPALDFGQERTVIEPNQKIWKDIVKPRAIQYFESKYPGLTYYVEDAHGNPVINSKGNRIIAHPEWTPLLNTLTDSVTGLVLNSIALDLPGGKTRPATAADAFSLHDQEYAIPTMNTFTYLDEIWHANTSKATDNIRQAKELMVTLTKVDYGARVSKSHQKGAIASQQLFVILTNLTPGERYFLENGVYPNQK